MLYGAIQLVRTCTKAGVKPIIGNEMYIINDTFDAEPSEEFGKQKAPKRYHLIVLAKNTIGYRNLVKLTTMAHLSGKVGKGIFARPCINKAQLYQHREGLIVSSACLGGEIPQAILNDDIESAATVATWYRDVFGEDFYLEIQDHGSAEDKKVNPCMVELSRTLGIKVIATNDSHFTNCLDAEAHDALICIQTGKLLTDENRLHYAGNEYFKSVEEMRKCFTDHLPREAIDEALYNTIHVAEKVGKYDLFGETRIPDFPIPDGFGKSHNSYLKLVSRENLRSRLDAREKAGLVDPEAEPQYFERLEFELNMICQMGFSSYFLVVWDYVRHAKELGIPVGPGRGSAAGSLVAFALRITDVDPIPFNLLFERFLNPERKSMPDIDTDFSVRGREKIIAYVSDRYGKDRVAQIITFNRLTSKAVLKDVARVHSVPYSEADRLAKLIPVVRGKPATLSAMLSDKTPSRDFRQMVEQNSSYQTWIDKAKRIEGTNKTYGIHAAGVVISASPLTDIVPLSRAKHGEMITQYAMEDVEDLGLLKMDFLGLKNLTVIETALEFIRDGRAKCGIHEELDFSVDSLPLDDEKTYRLLAEGELDGIFQLDASGGMRAIVRELRPSSLEDISSILALYRPGPLDAGLIPKFIRRKHGIDPIEYDHPLLEPILLETYGIMVYQEQIMRIARDLAGYSLGQADILRRAMGKKKTADMERERPRFVEGAKERGLSEEKAIELFDMMIKFAEYCFNKSHSTAYAYLTYQTAYLKANYPVEYSAALLRSNMNQSDKLVRYLADANTSGVRVAPPCVNRSDLGFTVDRSETSSGIVLFGLEAVKTVGGSVGHALLEERNARGTFMNIIDLVERVNLRVLNKRAMGALIKAGAFDSLHSNRKVLLDSLDGILVLRRKLRDRQKRRQTKGLSDEEMEKAKEADVLLWEEAEMQLTRDSESLPDFSLLERLAGEKITLGFYASGHPLFNLQEIRKALGCTRLDHIVGDASDEENAYESSKPGGNHSIPDGSEVAILSCVTELKRITTAKGKKMAKWVSEDSSGRLATVVFPGSYDIMEQIIQDSYCVETEGSAPEAQAVGDGPVVSKASMVVEEDARVIVWGKIDRESSGTAQIIVDDVQRANGVKAIVATAPFSKMRSPLTQLQVLRQTAAKLLEVELSKPRFSSYVDANGELRKRRWSKAVPLNKKNRVPLVLECVDGEGKVVSLANAGNSLRFPLDCEDLLQSLRSSTGFEIEMRSFGEDHIKRDTEGRGQNTRQAQKDETVDSHAAKSSQSVSGGTSRISIPSAATDVSLDLVSATTDSMSEISNQVETIPEISPSPASEKTTVDINSDGNGDSVAEVLEEPRPNVSVMGVNLTPAEHAEFLTASKHLRERKFEQTLTPVTATNRLEASLLASTRMGRHARRDAKSQRAYAQAAVQPDFRRERMSKPIEGGSIHGGPLVSSALQTTLNPVSASLAGDRDDIALEKKGDETEREKFPRNNNVTAKVAVRFMERSLSLPSTLRNTSNGSKFENGVSVKLPQTRANADHFPETDKVDAMLSASFEKNTQDGLEVSYDKIGFHGLLDAIALVAGETARTKTGSKCSVCGVSGLDITKLSETGISLKVSGHIGYTKGQIVYVLVDVRETKPSGKRKRVRSFDHVVCMLQAETELEAVTLKSKKSVKRVGIARLRLEKSATDGCTEVHADDPQKISSRARKTIVKSSNADFMVTTVYKGGEFLNLQDGGQILSSLSRAAQICLNRALHQDDGSFVTSLDGFVVDDPKVLSMGAQPLVTGASLSIRVHLEGTCYATSKVQAEALVRINDKGSTSCQASFRVLSRKHDRMRSVGVVANEDPLFDGAQISDFFRLHAEVLRT